MLCRRKLRIAEGDKSEFIREVIMLKKIEFKRSTPEDSIQSNGQILTEEPESGNQGCMLQKKKLNQPEIP